MWKLVGGCEMIWWVGWLIGRLGEGGRGGMCGWVRVEGTVKGWEGVEGRGLLKVERELGGWRGAS